MMRTDDDIAYVNAEFLGFPGYRMPWRARYTAYGIAVTLIAVLWILLSIYRVPMNFFTFVWTGGGIIAVTRWIGVRIGYETPLRSLIALWWHELGSKRTEKLEEYTFMPARVKVRDSQGRAVCIGCWSSHAHDAREAA